MKGWILVLTRSKGQDDPKVRFELVNDEIHWLGYSGLPRGQYNMTRRRAIEKARQIIRELEERGWKINTTKLFTEEYCYQTKCPKCGTDHII